MWGPLVLAGDMGAEQRRGWPTEPVPSLLTSERPIGEWLKPVPAQAGSFRTEGVGRLPGGPQQEVDFVPFYRLHRRTYSLYWDLHTSESWSKKIAEFEAAEAKRKILEAATIAFVQPGDEQKEKEFNQQGEETNVDGASGRRARRGKKWFSYDLPVGEKASLLITYFTVERALRTFEILVNGQRIGEQRIERSVPGSAAGRFFDVEYKLPAELLKDKKKITVRFQSTGGNEIAGVYGIRLIRADAER